jgi:hypothetical protein
VRKDQIIAGSSADPDQAAFDTMLDRGERILPDQLQVYCTRGTSTEQLRDAPPCKLAALARDGE